MNVINIPAEELCLSLGELSLRMKVPRDYDISGTERIREEILSLMDCRAVSVCVPVSYSEKGITLGGIYTESRDLRNALKGAGEALIFAVTLGLSVDRYLLRLSKTSIGEMFLADAIASAYAEAAADRAEELFLVEKGKRVRFSPGYGDLSLDIQPRVLSVLQAEKNLGITLTDSLLMKPQKSITAIIGIKNE